MFPGPSKVASWAMVSLRPINEANREAVEALRVSPAQEQFVSSVAESVLEATEHPDAHAKYWAVYADESPVGFVMIADEVDSPEYIPHYLWKLLIDERYQRRGLGTATLDLIVEYFRGRPQVEELWTSAGQGDGSPIAFYERYGFEQTGEIVSDNEVLLRLRLS
jgi:diamine N-acetyltransferase